MEQPSIYRQKEIVARLTALWAFGECALGGIMHAFKLPFTAVFVGGFAVLCIGLIAHYSQRNFSTVLQATLFVVLTKAAVTPYSPPTAYMAVGFQGFIGATLLCYGRPLLLMGTLFGGLALLESALQKLLTLWIFFDKSLYEAIDIFIPDVLENFGIKTEISWSAWIVGAYLIAYTFWGLFLGRLIPLLPKSIEEKASEYVDVKWSNDQTGDELKTSKKKQKWYGFALVLLFICLTFWFSGGKVAGAQKAIYAVWRTAAALLVWFFIVMPLARHWIQKWAKSRKSKDRYAVEKIIGEMPRFRQTALALYRHVRAQKKGMGWLYEYVLVLFAITLVGAENIESEKKE